MEAQPLRSISPPHSGEASSDKAWKVKVEGKKGKMKEESPSIKLGLGICANSAQNPVIKHGKPVFTTAQLHELQQQALIFKYIAAGFPVPLHLVTPIWNSVACPFGSSLGSIYKQYPSFIGFSPQGFDYRTMMDPEPGRCRRTDGKKWRCSRNVVPDQKYCERHMHRGHQRSRKHVESSQLAPPSNTKPAIKSNDVLGISKTINFQLITPSSSNAAAATAVATTTTTSAAGVHSESNEKNISGDKNSCKTNLSMITPSISAAVTTTTTTTTISRNKNKSNSNNDRNNPNHDGKGKSSKSIGDSNILNRSSKSGNKINVGSSLSPGLGFSPKSVLQVLGYGGSCFYRSEIELEPGRCRRTDGKKWRCSKDVLPSQKYCERHMHRGAKKHAGASQSAAVPSAVTTRGCLPCKMASPHKEDCGTLSTNLSISISTSQFLKKEEKNTTTTAISSSSDTAITDTAILGHGHCNFSP